MKKILLLILFYFVILQLSAQGITLNAKVVDDKGEPMISSYISLKSVDRTERKSGITDENGLFKIEEIQPNTYKIRISYLGYKAHKQTIVIADKNIDLGTVTLAANENELKEVEIKGKVPLAVQKGDTTEYQANAFKTMRDASAEELIEKMPGVVVENGKVQAQGEDVKQVLVDGKPFFGNDPTAALRNLPAEVISTIQVFDQKSDQSNFTGFDDGNTTKTINIVTKKNMRQGEFGKFTAGYGIDQEYKVAGNISLFENDKRISIIGQANNINEQNFSSEDLLGVVGSQSRRGGRGGRGGGGKGGRGRGGRGGGGVSARDFLVEQEGGVSEAAAFGINYSDKWGEKLEVAGSYFYNRSDNLSLEDITQQYIDLEDLNEIYTENNNSQALNLNHRSSMRLNYKFNKRTSLIMRPRISWQGNEGISTTLGKTVIDNDPLNQTANDFISDLAGLDFSNSLLIRHRFETRGKSLSLGLSGGYKNQTGESILQSTNQFLVTNPIVTESLDQLSDLESNGWNSSASLNYTEPLGKGMLMMTYKFSIQEDNSDKETYDYVDNSQDYTLLNTELTNIFSNYTTAHEVGTGYNFRKGNWRGMARVAAQWSALNGEQTFPTGDKIDKKYFNLIPFAMLRYRMNRSKDLRIFYRSNTQMPSIAQLQSVVNNSNPVQLTMGNPDLDQAVQHNVFLKYSTTNTDKATVFYVLLRGGFTQDYIANSTRIIRPNDLVLNDITVQPGAQLTRPVNLSGYWNTSAFVTYGMPVTALKSNLNFNLSTSYSKIPGLIDRVKNFSNNTAMGLGLVFSSNISETVDFTIKTTSNYSIIKNSTLPNNDFNYLNQQSSVKFNWIVGKDWIFRTQFVNQLYAGLGDLDQDYWLWNVSLGRKIFKNKRGEIALKAFDILNQNRSITRNVTEIYVEDLQTNVLDRYVMLMFTYNFRNFDKRTKK